MRYLSIILIVCSAAVAYGQDDKPKKDEPQSVSLSPLDRTVMGVVGSLVLTGLGIFWRWASPLAKSYIEAQNQNAQANVKVAAALENNSRAYIGLEATFRVMSRVIVSIQASMQTDRKLLLLIEDNPISVRLIRQICADLIRTYRMEFIDVMSLEDCFQHLQQAKVIVLDVNIEGKKDIELLKALIRLVACPVIIYSETAYNFEDFPGATTILKKDTSPAELRKAIEMAITGGVTSM